MWQKKHYKRNCKNKQFNVTRNQTVQKFKQINAIFEQSEAEWNFTIVTTKSFAEMLTTTKDQEHQTFHWTTCYEKNCMTHYSSKINANY